MGTTEFWSSDHFPVVYYDGEARSVLVDIASFSQIETIMDNLLNREGESEDAVLASSRVLKQMVAQSRQASPSHDWEKELDDL